MPFRTEISHFAFTAWELRSSLL